MISLILIDEKKPYFGGKKECDPGQEQEANEAFDPKNLICPGCAGINADCPKHGQEYM